MRIAVCLSGQLRNWELAYSNQINHWLYGGHQVDYFTHTWDYSGDRTHISADYVNRDVEKEEYDKFIQTYKPKKSKLDSKKQDFFYGNDHWSSLFYGFSHSILLKREYELENGFEYDIVVKSRPDVIFNPHCGPSWHTIEEEKYDDASIAYFKETHSDNKLFTTHGGSMPHEFGMFNINDCVFLSNSYTMDLMINIYFYRQQKINEKIPNYKNYNIMGPGVLIGEYCRDYGITTEVGVGFLETLIKDGCPTDLDLLTPKGYRDMDTYFRDWYKPKLF